MRNTQRYNQIEADGRRNTAAALAEEFKVSTSTINKIVKKLLKEQNTS
ncbi:winged helix-turn-helix transcriptional regulator [Ruegeria sp. SCP10]